MSPILNATLMSVLLAACATESVDGSLVTGPGSFSARVERGWAEVGFEPIVGATVALDDAAGGRMEAVSNELGLVAFNIDWDDGPFDLTVDPGIPGLPLFTAMDRGRLDDGLAVRFWDDRVLDDRVTLYGELDAGLAEPPVPLTYDGRIAHPARNSSVYINAHGAAGTELQGDLSAYAVQVLPDTDFQLMAVEVHDLRTWPDGDRARVFDRWTLVDVDGIAETTRMDLALTDDLDSSRFDGSFALPADRTDPLRDAAVATSLRVLATQDGALANPCGFASWLGRSDDGERVELSGEYVMPQLAQGAVTELEAISPSEGVGSIAWVEGTPDTWRTEPELLPVPELIDVEERDDGAWTLTWADAGVDGSRTHAQVYGADGALLWQVVGPEGDTMAIPAAPSSVDAAALAREARLIEPMTIREADLAISHLAYGQPWTLDLMGTAPAPRVAEGLRTLPTVQIAVDPDADRFFPAW